MELTFDDAVKNGDIYVIPESQYPFGNDLKSCHAFVSTFYDNDFSPSRSPWYALVYSEHDRRWMLTSVTGLDHIDCCTTKYHILNDKIGTIKFVRENMHGKPTMTIMEWYNFRLTYINSERIVSIRANGVFDALKKAQERFHDALVIAEA